MKIILLFILLFTGLTFAQSVKPLSVVAGTLTASLDIGNKEILAIHDVDSTFVGTTITLYASSIPSSRYTIVDFDGTTQVYTVTRGFYFVPNPQAVASIMSLKILSDSTETTTYNIIVGDVVGD